MRNELKILYQTILKVRSARDQVLAATTDEGRVDVVLQLSERYGLLVSPDEVRDLLSMDPGLDGLVEGLRDADLEGVSGGKRPPKNT